MYFTRVFFVFGAIVLFGGELACRSGLTTAAPTTDHHDDRGLPPHWSYTGDDGPSHWGMLHPAFAECGAGHFQSPIDIPREAETARSNDITFAYSTGPATVVDNGHTVQVTPTAENAINLGGAGYRLRQFHFHTPSEHAVEHRRHAIEIHLVHQDDADNIAVVGIFANEGDENERLGPFFERLPDERTVSPTLSALNPGWLLPAERTHYRYYGSLTTPPCSEGVKWTVMATPIQLSKRQIAAFQTLYRANARPLQPRPDWCLRPEDHAAGAR